MFEPSNNAKILTMKRRQGVVLITTILMAIIVAMVVTATISSAPTALASAAAYTDHQRALLAVDAGMAYARARFKEDLNWLGSHDSGPNVVVQTPDNSLVVIEDHGNVVGTIRFDGGQYGQFRIRFNHQDGSGNLDGLDDPSAEFTLDTPGISANNLITSSGESLFEQNNGEVKESGQSVQPFQAHITVEGLAGPALRDVNPMKPGSVDESLRLVRRVGEARIEANYSENLDAAAMAAGDLTAHLSNGSLDDQSNTRQLKVDAVQKKSDPVPPRVRTKKSLDITNDQPSQPSIATINGFLNTQNGSVSSGTRVDPTTSMEYEDASAGFYNMSWDDVSRSDPNDPDTVKMKAGTYVVWEKDTPSGPKPELHYYDMSLNDYIATMQALPPGAPLDPGLVLSSNLQEVRSNFASSKQNSITLHSTGPLHSDGSENRMYTNGLRAQLVMRDDVLVEPTSNTSDFNFLPQMGFIENEIDQGEFAGQVSDQGYPPQHIMFQFDPRENDDVCLTVEGETNVNARIYGEGASIVSEGGIKIVGAGSLATNEITEESDGLSLYSKEDVDVSTFYPAINGTVSGRYTDLKINGVVYAWGDVTFALAPERGEQSNHHGSLRLSGAVVAYGGDPGDPNDSTPGVGFGGSRGNLEIRGSGAHLRYNPNYLLSLDKLVTPSDLEILSFTLK